MGLGLSGLRLGLGQQLWGTAWSPAKLFPTGTEEGLFLDFSDISTLYTDQTFSTNISAIGDPVGGVLDKSGNGNHMIQATTAARPIWTRHPKSGVRNLLNASDTIVSGQNSGQWNPAGAVISGGKLIPNVGAAMTSRGGNRAIRSNNLNNAVPLESNTQYTFSFTASVDGVAGVGLNISGSGVADQYVNFDVAAVDVAFAGSGVTSSSIAAVTGGARVSATFTTGTVLSTAGLEFYAYDPVVVGDGSKGVFVTNVQIEKSATATAYQARVSKYDVTEAGVADCYGLTFDGVDDHMVTAANLDLSGTSEVTLTAGGYKATDAAGNKTLAVLGAIANGSGRFAMEAPSDSGQYMFNAFYASNRTANVTSGYAAPLNAVATGQASLSGVSLRLDGTQVAADLTPNTGGFSSELFNIGRRGNNTSWYAGTIYGVTLTDYILDASQLAALEEWTAARTPEVTLA